MINGEPVTKKVIVYEVNPMTDSLEALALKFQVSKMSIRTLNGFTGDEIYFLKEIRIPWKGQTDIAPREIAPEVQEKIDEQLREKALQMLSIFIADKEKKNAPKLIQYRKAQKLGPDCRGDSKAEATYYLEEANYEFIQARD